MANEQESGITDEASLPSSRRGALAALLGGSALGLAALSGPGSGKTTKQAKRRRKRNQRQNASNDNETGAGLPSVQYVYHDNIADGSGVFAGFAECPSGYVPIGWGVDSSFPTQSILTSVPQQSNNRWLVEVDGAVEGGRLTVVAICLRASDDSAETEGRKTGRNVTNGRKKKDQKKGKRQRRR